jgi:hypothetical protein
MFNMDLLERYVFSTYNGFIQKRQRNFPPPDLLASRSSDEKSIRYKVQTNLQGPIYFTNIEVTIE